MAKGVFKRFMLTGKCESCRHALEECSVPRVLEHSCVPLEVLLQQVLSGQVPASQDHMITLQSCS